MRIYGQPGASRGTGRARHNDPSREITEVRGPDEIPEDRDWKPAGSRGTYVPRLPVLASPGCWCGLTYGHDWPGKTDGAPHPKDMADALRLNPKGPSAPA